MTINHHQLLITILCWVFSTSAFADIYQYIDESGITHYSDSPYSDQYVLIINSDSKLVTTPVDNKSASITTDVSSLPANQSQLLAQIDKSAINNQLDSELIHAVIHVESAYKTQAKSRKGAQGLMQLMPATAYRMGVKNSLDSAQNIEGGAKYLRELLNLFNNDLSLAVAAYNAGENAVIKYGNHIPPYKETQAYVPKVLRIYNELLKQRQQAQAM